MKRAYQVPEESRTRWRWGGSPAEPESTIDPEAMTAGEYTVKRSVPVPVWESGLVTTTLQGPMAAEAVLKVAVSIRVGLDTVTLVAMMSDWPALVSLTVAPAEKLVPVMEPMSMSLKFDPLSGRIAVMVGAPEMRVKAIVSLLLPRVTVM